MFNRVQWRSRNEVAGGKIHTYQKADNGDFKGIKPKHCVLLHYVSGEGIESTYEGGKKNVPENLD